MSFSLGASSVYRHEQTEPATVWTVNHGQDVYPVADVYINIGGKIRRIIPQAVTYVSPNVFTVTFSSPQTGYVTVC